MDDIICTVAWTCGESDCRSPGGWHLSNYWTYGDGTYGIDNYADGDHESIEESVWHDRLSHRLGGGAAQAGGSND